VSVIPEITGKDNINRITLLEYKRYDGMGVQILETFTAWIAPNQLATY
jgi:hypothetical protein